MMVASASVRWLVVLLACVVGCGRSRLGGESNVDLVEGGDGGSGSGGARAGSGGARAGSGGAGAGSGGQAGFGGLAGMPVENERCGNQRAEGFEECDWADLRGRTCQSLGFDGGMLGCDPAACVLRTEGCFLVAPGCGDGIAQAGEACDGMDLGGQSCRSLGLGRGALGCTAQCAFDTAGCTLCGDGVVTRDEACDGTRLQGQSCVSLGFSGGQLACSASCAFDTGACALCGDGVVSAGENCDGGDLLGASCASLGLGTGMLACSPFSCHFDTRGCTSGPSCGNGVAEAEEQCDGSDLAGNDCGSLALGAGTLQCNGATCRYDTSACVREGGRECVRRCTDSNCTAILATCDMTPGCNEIRECLDRCHQDFSPSCAFSCASTSIGAIAVATVASDCVADCAFDCR